tara:strand:- start:240 stop:782 length:543 start_codon:yes stop_codon:yes gene_type:complete
MGIHSYLNMILMMNHALETYLSLKDIRLMKTVSTKGASPKALETSAAICIQKFWRERRFPYFLIIQRLTIFAMLNRIFSLVTRANSAGDYRFTVSSSPPSVLNLGHDWDPKKLQIKIMANYIDISKFVDQTGDFWLWLEHCRNNYVVQQDWLISTKEVRYKLRRRPVTKRARGLNSQGIW